MMKIMMNNQIERIKTKTEILLQIITIIPKWDNCTIN